MPQRRLLRLALVAATASLVLAPGAGASPRAHTAVGCPYADTSALGAPAGEMRTAVLCLVNAQRATHQLPPLRESRRLDRSAQAWTDRMVRSGQFTHGTSFWARISAVGYDWSHVGENIATGFTTPRQVVTGWMGSLGHCENILDPGFANVGTGVDTGRLGPYGPATWTQDFGLVMGHPAPSRNGGPAAGCPYRAR